MSKTKYLQTPTTLLWPSGQQHTRMKRTYLQVWSILQSSTYLVQCSRHLTAKRFVVRRVFKAHMQDRQVHLSDSSPLTGMPTLPRVQVQSNNQSNTLLSTVKYFTISDIRNSLGLRGAQPSGSLSLSTHSQTYKHIHICTFPHTHTCTSLYNYMNNTSIAIHMYKYTKTYMYVTHDTHVCTETYLCIHFRNMDTNINIFHAYWAHFLAVPCQQGKQNMNILNKLWGNHTADQKRLKRD